MHLAVAHSPVAIGNFGGRLERVLMEIKWIIIFCDIIYYCLCHEIRHHYDKLVIFVANFYIK